MMEMQIPEDAKVVAKKGHYEEVADEDSSFEERP